MGIKNLKLRTDSKLIVGQQIQSKGRKNEEVPQFDDLTF